MDELICGIFNSCTVCFEFLRYPVTILNKNRLYSRVPVHDYDAIPFFYRLPYSSYSRMMGNTGPWWI